jgi:hypothetical protein
MRIVVDNQEPQSIEVDVFHRFQAPAAIQFPKP